MMSLSKMQKEIMQEFYSLKPAKIVYNKAERKKIWLKATARSHNLDLDEIENKCPALVHQILKSYESGKNIQSAVFSECVYAQALANMLNLNEFYVYRENEDIIPSNVKELLMSHYMVSRYIYANYDKSRMLIQAGGNGGIDSALISVLDSNIFTIEFKEPFAKTSEPDLPKYGEDGIIKITDDFIKDYPQFKDMINEHKNLNFFNVIGSNIHDFAPESIDIAVSNNYIKKYADVICTEDINNYLIMIPADQISLWAKIEGEIRPAGRNHYAVWTPNALKKFIFEKGGKIESNVVELNINNLELRKERGRNNFVSGYKINSIFFIYEKDCIKQNNIISFNLDDVQQLNPTVSGKILFNKPSYFTISDYYKKLF